MRVDRPSGGAGLCSGLRNYRIGRARNSTLGCARGSVLDLCDRGRAKHMRGAAPIGTNRRRARGAYRVCDGTTPQAPGTRRCLQSGQLVLEQVARALHGRRWVHRLPAQAVITLDQLDNHLAVLSQGKYLARRSDDTTTLAPMVRGSDASIEELIWPWRRFG